ncbi:chaperonin containing TCP1, group II (cytosolic) [Monocercomonoides exilis]|uniref:chaperonin containing TCP1, group II (cytosolic) n=1 Tax=Monocercomonoides exilis TaxID=2049356 RepID=UPI003559F089|nr:chaperonin containing TCP1, group II (cytosolic) [Monocercomonoides exilis]|eukprot:MONOS_6673.1-p1 / transcript=MONOS_6673.1 / gene=MONOS_6673 / organism=Monocercomonoides_exilis_PA203 / gene_product=chaperonin containing TCP1, group II (cytosolic) / transcript_product=chaperonin containing TCP1, group II (cytosolic) / location=Mono_scaffold00214:65711-67518(-) / protein_length=551 / sequence_SO=supercontig / SO=protein_coding / is_pseudo=false
MNLFKEDTRHEEGKSVPIKNIEAVQDLTNIIRTNLGPNGLSKLVVTHLDKVIVTRRTETVLYNLTVEHPVAKLVVMAAKNQADEVGDGTTQIVAWIGELLSKIKPLILMRLPIKDIQTGLDLSLEHALNLLPKLAVHEITDPFNLDQVTKVLKPVIGAKMSGQEDFLAPLVAKACIDICPKNPANFNVDNVRFAKVMGGIVTDSSVVRGFCIPRTTEGEIKKVTNAKIAVFGCAIDRDEGETKGTIVMNTADELQSYTAKEEMRMKAIVEEIISSGANVVVTGSTVSEIALHYLEQNHIMVIKILSKFDLRRFCLATHATSLVRLGKPTAEELGFCHSIRVTEVGGMEVLIISQEEDEDDESSSSSSSSEKAAVTSRVSTIILRSSTQAALDDVERVMIDAVNTYKDMVKNSMFVAGGGAFEAELSQQMLAFGATQTNLAQYSIGAFAESLLCVPRILAETAGMNANETITQLTHAHAQGKVNTGVNVESLSLEDMKEKGIFDSLYLKEWVLRFGVDCVKTVLSVDSIIMSKPAGIKPPGERTIGGADQD